MATTHVFAGLTIAATVAIVAPEFTLIVALAAILGSTFPDLDLVASHRRTLHFPVYYFALALPAGALALIAPGTATVLVATFFLAAGVHSAMDLFGGGLEPRPWEATSDRAVYSHYHGRWLEPRRWVRYDGAPEDLLLACALAIPGLLVFNGIVREAVLVMLAISVGYVVVRKPLVRVGERLVAVLPQPVLARVPDALLPVEGNAVSAATESETVEGSND